MERREVFMAVILWNWWYFY